MMFDAVVTLISELDEKTEESKEVFATVEGVGQKEFFSAAQSGFKAEYKVSLWQSDYEGQTLAEFEDYGQKRRFNVYRKYPRKDGKIELYLSDKLGVRRGNQH